MIKARSVVRPKTEEYTHSHGKPLSETNDTPTCDAKSGRSISNGSDQLNVASCQFWRSVDALKYSNLIKAASSVATGVFIVPSGPTTMTAFVLLRPTMLKRYNSENARRRQPSLSSSWDRSTRR